jgi:DNA-3-methyladenine glycosylase II
MVAQRSLRHTRLGALVFVLDAELAADRGHVAVARVLAVLEHALAGVGLVLGVGRVERVVLGDDPGIGLVVAAHGPTLPAAEPLETRGYGRASAVHLPIPQPYDFAISTARFREWGSDGVTVWHEGALYRVISGREVRIEPEAGGVRIQPDGLVAVGEVSILLGLPFDLDAFRAWAAQQPVLADIVGKLPGLRPPLAPNLLEALVSAITTQQVSLQSAAAIRSRFVARYGTRYEHATEFPSRERVAGASVSELRALGFSERKAEYLLGLARSDLDLEHLRTLPDEHVIETLTAVRGIGRWTADWFLGRALARPSAWPAGDLGLRKAVAAFYADAATDGRLPSIEEVRTMGERFAPFQNLSAHYLLAALRVAE